MFHRAAASTLFLLMLNVLALGDGLVSVDGATAVCNGMADSGAQMSEMPDMASMNMPAAPAGTGSEKAPSPTRSGCNLPWAVGCTSTAPCGPTAAVSLILHRHTMAVRHLAIRVLDTRAPESLAVAPELPPPRA